MRKIAFASLAFIASVVGGCATSLEPGAEKVRLITAEQKSSCDSLGIVSADQQLGPYKASNSMNKVLNEVAHRGGNGVFIISSGRSGIDGQSVTAEAVCSGVFTPQILRPTANHSAGRPASFCRLTWRYSSGIHCCR
jgi:hypothetical protein